MPFRDERIRAAAAVAPEPSGKRVLLNGKPVTNAIHGNVEDGVVLCFDYDGEGRIMRDEYCVPVLIEMRGGVVTITDVKGGN